MAEEAVQQPVAGFQPQKVSERTVKTRMINSLKQRPSRAFGIVLSPSRTLAVFGASQLIGGLPGTPGGLGYAEGGLAGSLAFFDVTSAFAPILVFRMISLWLPALAGLSAGGYSFLKIRAGASQES